MIFHNDNAGIYVPPVAGWIPPEAASNTLWLPLTANPNDISGNGHNFTEVGSPTYSLAPGGSVNCLRLNGTTDYLSLANPQGLMGDASFSFAVWVYAVGWGSNTFGRIVSKGDVPRPIDSWFNGAAGNRNLSVLASNEQGKTPDILYTTEDSVSLNTWYHIASSWRSGYQVVYMNNSPRDNNSTTYTTLESNTEPMLIGNRNDLVRHWDGYFSNFMYWKDVELSQAEFLDVQNNTSPI